MNKGEQRLVDFQFGYSGGFFRLLFQTIGKADDSNRALLGKGFPEEVEAYNRFKTENGYWPKLVDEFNKENGTKLDP